MSLEIVVELPGCDDVLVLVEESGTLADLECAVCAAVRLPPSICTLAFAREGLTHLDFNDPSTIDIPIVDTGIFTGDRLAIDVVGEWGLKLQLRTRGVTSHNVEEAYHRAVEEGDAELRDLIDRACDAPMVLRDIPDA